MSRDYTSISSYMSDIIKDISRQKEEILHNELNELISRGLLEVQESIPALFHSQIENKYILKQTYKLVLKDREYIQKLEEENKTLKEKLEGIAKALEEIKTGNIVLVFKEENKNE